MNKTIRYAVKRKFNKECQEALIDAFSATNCMDLYDGDLKSYIQVIAQKSRSKTERINQLEAALETIRRITIKQ